MQSKAEMSGAEYVAGIGALRAADAVLLVIAPAAPKQAAPPPISRQPAILAKGSSSDLSALSLLQPASVILNISKPSVTFRRAIKSAFLLARLPLDDVLDLLGEFEILGRYALGRMRH